MDIKICRWIGYVNLLFILTTNFPGNEAQPDQSDPQWFSNSTCVGDSDCTNLHYDALCLPYAEEQGGVNVSVTYCTCNNNNKFYKVDDRCVFYADVGETCDDVNSVCRDVNAQCTYDGDRYGIQRCQCRNHTRLVKHNNEIICAYELNTVQDTSCVPCVMNLGVCFSLDENDSHDGCYCPATLSGNNCEVAHVNVTCDTDFMHVCYLPHPEVDLEGDAWLHVENYGHKVGCTAVKRQDICGPGQYYLQLPLAAATRDMCFTRKLEYSGTVRYTNQLVVQQNRLFSSPEDIFFGVFCSFKRIHDLNALSIPVNSISDSEIGQEINPMLTLTVKTQIGQTATEYTTFRVGDMVFFHLYLDTSEGYSAMRVEFCTLSSSPVIPDATAETKSVIAFGCPVQGQQIITDDNTWTRVQEQANEMQTGLVQIIKFRQGDSLNMHCTIKLCIVGSEPSCDPIDCTSSSRRRRDVMLEDHSRFVRVHSQFSVNDGLKSTEINTILLAAIISSVLLILLVLVTSVVLIRRARRPRARQIGDVTLPDPDPLEIMSTNYLAGLKLEDPPNGFSETSI